MGVSRFARLTAAMTFILLIAGGLVTSTDAGLSVPDWPLSYGGLFPPMVGGIRYEHTHRVIAGIVAVMIAVLAVWLRRREPRPWVRALGYAAAGAVLAQAILGGLTVILLLPPPVSVAHACLAQTVFCLVVGLAVVTSTAWDDMPHGHEPDLVLRRLAIATVGVLALQLAVGAIIRHSGLGLPVHLAGAVVVAVMVTALGWRARRSPARREAMVRVATAMQAGVVAQWLLGLGVLVYGQPVLVTTAHVAVGALLLAGSCVVALLASRDAAASSGHAVPPRAAQAVSRA